LKIDIIATIGPSSCNPKIIRSLEKEGVSIFRINGVHGNIDYIEGLISLIKKHRRKAGVLVDLPGNKIRVNRLKKPIRLKIGTEFFLSNQQTNFPDFFKTIRKRDLIYANDSKLRFECISIDAEGANFLSHSEGDLQNNKGLHGCNLNTGMPFLFQRDKELVRAAAKHDVEYIGLSYVRDADDIRDAKRLFKSMGYAPRIISKVETRSAVSNVDKILKEVDHILIDRGDLSAEIGIENISHVQEKLILKIARNKGKKVFLATQFLHNMVNNPLPLIAEVNDLYNTLRKEIHGIQLSEEVSIGRHPVECVRLINRMLPERQKRLKL